MTDASLYLLEIGAHDGTNPLTLRVSNGNFGGYVTGPNDTPADTEYVNGIIDPGYVSRHLFGEGKTFGQSQVGYGDIVISNIRGMFDAWLDYGFDGRQVVLKRMGSAKMSFSSAQTLLKATMTRITTSDAYKTLNLRLYDRRLELDRNISAPKTPGAPSDRYPGTANIPPDITGTSDLKGKVKPQCFGRCENIAPVCVNPQSLLYQVNDAAVSAITVYDGGAQLTPAGDFVSIAALAGATIPPGKVGTCLALGFFRLGGSPAKLVTADVTEGATIGLRYAGAIAQRILAKMGLTGSDNINASSFAALNTAAPYEMGVFVNEERSGLSVLADVLGSVGGWIVPNTLGVFEVGRLAAPGTSAWELKKFDIHTDGDGSFGIASNPDTEGGLPTYGITLNYRRCWQTQDDAALAGCVSVNRRGFLANAIRSVRAENRATLTKHPLSPEMTIDTLILSEADATAEAARRLALYGVRRDVITISARRGDVAAATLGSTGTIILNRLGYNDPGRKMVVIGRREDPRNERVDLTLWG